MRTRPRIGHTGAWQGFRTSIERFPESGLTVIVLTNLEQARPEAVALAVAGILDPALTPPHRLTAALPGPVPPAPLDSLLAAIASASDSDSRHAGASPLSRRRRAGRVANHVVGRIRVDAARLRPGRRPRHHPPRRRGRARVLRPRSCRRRDVAVTVSYTADWRAADVGSYDF